METYATGVIFTLFGLIIGSFLNVVVLRQATGRSLSGRSHCPSCNMQLTWKDLIPVVSWLMLRGRCRSCGSRISAQYPLVEATTALLFGLIGFSQLAFPQMLLGALFAALMLAIAVYDVRHTIIPDVWSYAAGLVGLAYAFVSDSGFEPIYLLLAGPAAAAPLAGLWAVSRGRWMGFGDVKLAFGIGWLLGPVLGPAAILFAFIIGAFVSVFILLPLPRIVQALKAGGITALSGGRAGFTMKSEVPFGPFLIASCFILWFLTAYGNDLSAYVAGLLLLN